MQFAGSHILSVQQFERADVEHIFALADRMGPYARRRRVTRVLAGAILGSMFFEPSTRTRVSFGSAFNLHGGEVPPSFADLEELPGVGHKTASVVMAQAFGVPAFPVDTHIHRLAKRWRLSKGTSVEQTERDLKRLFREAHWNQLHLRIIFYGREHCTARGCDGHTCELCATFSPRVPRARRV